MENTQVLFSAQVPPVHFQLVSIAPQAPLWSNGLQIIYISQGEMVLQINGTPFHLQKNDLAVVNPSEIYFIQQGDGIAGVFQLELALFSTQFPSLTLPHLETLISWEAPYAHELRSLLADIIRIGAASHSPNAQLDGLASATKLLSLLIRCCADREPSPSGSSSQYHPLLQAIAFTSQEFHRPITVRDAAKIAGFSPSHFSKLFTAFVGTPYTDYLTALRLQAAERNLHKGLTISQIASESGFADYRAFARAFRKKHGYNPSQAQKTPPPVPASQTEREDALSPSSRESLAECLNQLASNRQTSIPQTYIRLPTLSFATPRTPFIHSWQKTIGVGRAIFLLQHDNQQALADLQRNVRFQYASVHNFLDDDMQVVHRTLEGKLDYYFGSIDTVLDFLLSIGLKPILELGMMPSLLAKHPHNTVFTFHSISSLPAQQEDWNNLIEALILHLLQRYGRSQVESWKFTLWGKPDMPVLPFGFSDVDAYFSFYRGTYQTVKSCDQKLHFSSPALLLHHPNCNQWHRQFFQLCQTHRCLPDSLRFAFYLNAPPSDLSSPRGSREFQYVYRPDAMQSALRDITPYIKSLGLPYTHGELAEWNLSISQRELLNDTSYKAVYIVRNALECWNHSLDFSYQGLCDAAEEAALIQDLFHGGRGLFTRGNLRKPAYYAFLLLSHLGDQLLAQGDGYIVTCNEQGIQVLFYNYCHFSPLFAQGDRVQISSGKRYTPFVDQQRKLFTLTLTHLPSQEYMLTNYRLNRQCGSVYDNWISMGMIPISTREEHEYLQGCSQPFMTKAICQAKDGAITLSPQLEPFEVNLYLISRYHR